MLTDELRGRLPFLLVPAGVALIAAGLFAWLQPGGPAPRAAELPGMASVIGWTALAIAVAVAAVLISMLLGLPGSQGTLIGGPWVTLMLGFSVLNTVLLGLEIWVAHLVGPVTSSAADALSRPQGKIYLPYVITSGVPLLVWAAVLAVLVFGLIEGARWLRTRRLPDDTAEQYRNQAKAFRDRLTEPDNRWYWSGLRPFPPPGDETTDKGQGQKWEQTIARVQFLGRAPHDATWLLWGIILAQLAMAVSVWQLHLQPPTVISDVGVFIAGLALPALMAFLYSAWSDPTKRRTIGVLWDVGTFWPRSYHPLSPPCYTERAVPELQRRMWWLHDNGGRVALVAHSQGTVLAAAALVQPGCRPEGDHPALITFGCPLYKLYTWGFPAYVDSGLLEPLEPGGAGHLNDWRNFYYPTDPIGGSVAPDLSAAGGDPVDVEFLDPAECYYVYGQPPPASQGHSGYWADPRVWDVINRVAAGLPDEPPPPGNGAAPDTGTSGISPELLQELVEAPKPSPTELAELAVGPDGGVEAVEVPAAEGAVSVDGDGGKSSRLAGSGFVVLLQVGAELLDRLLLVRSQVCYHGHLGAGPVGPGILVAVGRGHQEMVVGDLDVVPHLLPRDAGRHQADRGRVAVVELKVLEHAPPSGGLLGQS